MPLWPTVVHCVPAVLGDASVHRTRTGVDEPEVAVQACKRDVDVLGEKGVPAGWEDGVPSNMAGSSPVSRAQTLSVCPSCESSPQLADGRHAIARARVCSIVPAAWSFTLFMRLRRQHLVPSLSAISEPPDRAATTSIHKDI